MNIDPKNNTITCDCGHSVQIKDAELYNCDTCQSYHFDCSRCEKSQTIPLGFNDYLMNEISKHVLEPYKKPEWVSDEIADLFLGQNQVPLTDKLIDQLVKEKGIKREELIYLRKKGATYSISRDSFVFPPEVGLE